MRIQAAKQATCMSYVNYFVCTFFLGMLNSAGRGCFLALSAAGQARGPPVHYDALRDPDRAVAVN